MDHCIAESTSKLLEGLGHTVVRLKEALPINSPDPLVAKVSEKDGYILVSHDGDFDKIAPKIPKGERTRFRKLSRIHLSCSNAKGAERIGAAMSFIEFEWKIAQARSDKRIFIVIQTDIMKTRR